MTDSPTQHNTDTLNQNPSPSFKVFAKPVRENFKTFTLLQQQEDIISKVESNLQKTLDLFRSQNDNTSSSYQEKTETTKLFADPYLEKDEFIENLDGRLRREDLLASHRSGYSSKRGYEHKSSPEIKQRIENDMRENSSLKFRMDELKPEEKEKSPLKESKGYSDHSEESDKSRSGRKEGSSEKKMNGGLQEEILELREENRRLKEALDDQKRKTDITITELERENHGLVSKLNESNLKETVGDRLFNSYDQTEEESFKARNQDEVSEMSFMMEQIMKDKQELESRYNDLFISYSMLLEHNKALSQKIENLEREDEMKEIETEKRILQEKSFGVNKGNLSLRDNINTSLLHESSVGKIRKNKERDHILSISLLDEEKDLTTNRKSLLENVPLAEEFLFKSGEKQKITKEHQNEKKTVGENKTKGSPVPRIALSPKPNNQVVSKVDKEKKSAVKGPDLTCKNEESEKENKPKFTLSIKKNLPPQKSKKEYEKELLQSTARSKLSQRSNQQEPLLTSPRRVLKTSYMSPNENSQKLKQGIGSKKSPSKKEDFSSPQPKKQILYSKGVKRG